MFTPRQHPSSPPIFCFGSVLLIFLVFYVSLCSEFRVVMSVMISELKRMFGSSLPPVVKKNTFFVGGLMSYLCYLFLFVYSGVQHILCCVFVLFSWSCLCCQFLCKVHF